MRALIGHTMISSEYIGSAIVIIKVFLNEMIDLLDSRVYNGNIIQIFRRRGSECMTIVINPQ